MMRRNYNLEQVVSACRTILWDETSTTAHVTTIMLSVARRVNHGDI